MQPLQMGLTDAQAEQRRAAGQTNQPPRSPTKTTAEIVRDNLCTYFNLVFLILAVMLALVGSWLNMTFLGVVAANALIGIVQQLRAKKAVDELTLVANRPVRCLREGQWRELTSDQLVLDDVVSFGPGDQVCADAVLLEGEAGVNESLITGEAVPIRKSAGDTLRSGSFLVNGSCKVRLTAVGAQSYANRLANDARTDGHKVAKGEMMRSLDLLIRGIGVALVPLGVVLLYKQRGVLGLSMRSAVEGTVAALVGMIPEGLYLLTSVALAVSMLRLARRRVLTRDMNCIETLARVDVLCVDKTGTITEPVMQAADPVPLPGHTAEEIQEVLAAFYQQQTPDNDTARALCTRFGAQKSDWQQIETRGFDPTYKYSAAVFAEQGSYVVGAPDFVSGSRFSELEREVTAQIDEGRRVLLLARCRAPLPARPGPLDPAQLEFLALLPLQNRVRETAPETFRYFAEQGVEVKVISGDHPRAVSRVAQAAGIPGADRAVDASTLNDEASLAAAAQNCTVFGRVTPEQKRRLVRVLQSRGHTVAMTGDGVNDVLALKDADCGIAMASGAQAASQVAQLVLLDSDFAALPEVVAEGRRVINNIQRSAALYLVKNLFSFFLSCVMVVFTAPYPFQPLHLTLISAVTIGIPSFVLALEPNHEQVRGRFLTNVLCSAAPGGLTDFLLVLAAQSFAVLLEMEQSELSLICAVVLLVTGLSVLWRLCRPWTAVHRVLWGSMALLAAAGLALLAPALRMTKLSRIGGLILLLLAVLAPHLTVSFSVFFDWLHRALVRRGEKRAEQMPVPYRTNLSK